MVTVETGPVRVGTCGYSSWDAPEGWEDEYDSKLQAFADRYDLLEVNRTFYDLPRVSTAERWRREVDAVNPQFEFVVKAWQAVTHPTSSPTWRGTDDLTDAQREAFGYLSPAEPVVEAWERTREFAAALDADVVLLQTPPSFDATEAHERNARDLLGRIDRGGLALAWEPRGDWLEDPDRVAALCDDLDLIHAVDPFSHESRSAHPWTYWRLHGRNEDPYDYDYEYTDDELAELAARIEDEAADSERVYCLFNTFAMYGDVRRLVALS